MKHWLETLALGSLACVVASGQSRPAVSICDITAVNNVNDCYFLDTSKIGALKFEDYKVTNPVAIPFDLSVRQKQLAALGADITATLCQMQPAFADPAPTITFNKTNVKAQIYQRTTGVGPVEFVDAQFTDFMASNGYSSPSFGVRMTRQYNADGTEASAYQIQVQNGNPGLENIPGLPAGVGLLMDPTGPAVTRVGTLPASNTLSQAIYGVFSYAQSIMSAAVFTSTAPTSPPTYLWNGPEIISLTAQIQLLIAAAASHPTPPGVPIQCTPNANGYPTCVGTQEITNFANSLVLWGGEYLAVRSPQSLNVLMSNLRTWATANAPAFSPDYTGGATRQSIMMDVATALAMLWPVLRTDPAISASDQMLVDNWIASITALPGDPAFTTFPNDLGDWAAEIAMAQGIERSDNSLFAFGTQRFYGALVQMRPDGSLPLSARLSACSAVYSNVDLAHLVAIAEMAATQGYDLYSLSVNGKSLDTAIKFLLDARDNPALLYQYSKAGFGACFEGTPGDPPDFNAVFGPGYQVDLAWMEAYLARFPYSATAGRIRTILGSNVAAAPFPLMNTATGLNATCAFRAPFEFHPITAVNVVVVSGDGQTAGPNQPAPAPLSVRVLDSLGKAVTGVLVSFAVTQGSANLSTPAQVLTDATGLASASVSVAKGPVTVTATSLGVPAKFSLVAPSGLAIYSGGIAGIGSSVPSYAAVSPGALFSIYGQNFAPSGTGRRVNPDELVRGALPTTLLGVCVSVGGQNAPLLDVYPGLINAVAPLQLSNTKGDVVVTTGCGTSTTAQSLAESVNTAPVSPEFLDFAIHADGLNPVAAVNATTGVFVGPAELGAGFSPAHPGDIVTVYGSGFGPQPQVAGAPYAAAVSATGVIVRLGSITLDPKDVLYAGGAPDQIISQLNIRIPQSITAGQQALQIRFLGGALTSLPGPYLTIAVP
jgi:uncharacterized protein (TIGR03437 family)